MEREQPYFDKNGKEITEFALLKFYHFTGARRKKHYMYKWVKLVDWNGDGKLFWYGFHLMNDSGDKFYLKAVADKDRRLQCEIVQEVFKQSNTRLNN